MLLAHTCCGNPAEEALGRGHVSTHKTGFDQIIKSMSGVGVLKVRSVINESVIIDHEADYKNTEGKE
ncbi:hypothetical protein D3C72_2123800 [compost metagenome]